MAVRVYILIETEMGKCKGAAEALEALGKINGCRIAVDTVTGPYDIIAEAESENLGSLDTFINDIGKRIDGLVHTTTCICMGFG